MIDLQTQEHIAIRDVRNHIPGNPHLATIWRWIYRGVRGQKLGTIVVGGRRFTTKEEIEKFIAATTATAAGGEPTPARTAKQRARDIARAELELRLAGIR